MKKLLQFLYCIALLLILSEANAMKQRSISEIKADIAAAKSGAQKKRLELELRRAISRGAQEAKAEEAEEAEEEQPIKKKKKKGVEGGVLPPPVSGQKYSTEQLETMADLADTIGDLRNQIKATLNNAWNEGSIQEPYAGRIYQGAIVGK